MNKLLQFLVLPDELSDFERGYLRRVNRIALYFFAAHVPAFVLIAWLNDTGPGLAALFSLAVVSGPLLAQSTLENPRHVSVVYGVTAMFMGGLLVHFGQGPVQIEMHFYFFALVAMCAIFANPLVVVAAAVTVALHHLLVWLVLPKSVFNYSAQWWVVAVHAAFVVLESAAACFISRSFFDNVIGLDKIVQARTAALNTKNRDMRLLLDNVQQGFVTIDRKGQLNGERSAAVDAWFGAPSASASWVDYLATFCPPFAERTRLSWEEVEHGIMPLEVTLQQMPRQLAVKDAQYRFEYRPIGAVEPHEQFLVIITDVTMELARELAETERREGMALFERVLTDRSSFEGFVEEATQIVALLACHTPTELAVVKRLLHTLKGNAALYDLTSVAQHCHELENFIAEEGVHPPTDAFVPLLDRWGKLARDIQTLLGTRRRSLEIDDEQYAALEKAARTGESGPPLLRRIGALKLEATANRLHHFQEQALRMAERLGKTDVQVEIKHHQVRLDPRRWAEFWNAFIHALRNAVDHGLEATEARIAAGKLSPSTITLSTREDDDQLLIEISDNGRGIDWDRVAARAKGMGLPTGTASDLEKALFVDGVSTASSVSDISGRGIGMGALLIATEALGGKLSIHSVAQEGTTIRFAFPATQSLGSDYPTHWAAVS